MEAVYINENFISAHTLNETLGKFFKANTPESAQVLFWKLFQCWTIKDCTIKAEITNEEVALFFDQLIDLVAAAYILHEANRVSTNLQEGEGHE